MRASRLGAAAVACGLALAACSPGQESEPRAGAIASPSPEPPECPLTGLEPERASLLARPAVGVKVENARIAYPLAGLEHAEVVFEELVEGGITRFLAIYHCTDATKVGPVRSARFVDPAIVRPITRILGAAGGNAFVREELDRRDIVVIDEDDSSALKRFDRSGLAREHTLYANTKKLRKIGVQRFDDPPPDHLFSFAPLDRSGRKVREISLTFSDETTIVYRWRGGQWRRFDHGARLEMESGTKIAADNVLVEQHRLVYSKRLVDVQGTPSVQVKDRTGSGPAWLFRDGRAIKGRWVRKSIASPVRFETKAGDEMVFAPGTIWVELLPTGKGQIKGKVRFR